MKRSRSHSNRRKGPISAPLSPVEWTSKAEDIVNIEEQRVLYAAIDSFYQYGKTAHFNTTHTRRQALYALPREHWELLAAPPFNYLDTLNAIDDALDKNADLALAIYHAGLQAFGLMSLDSNTKYIDSTPWRGKATPNDLEKARGTLRQFYRDWSAEGSAEREVYYHRILKALQTERTTSGQKLKVLVPGAGLGRLVFDLCAAGFDAEGNEISYHQLLASSYVLNAVKSAACHTLYPWIHSFSNHKTRADHMHCVAIPDIHCAEILKHTKNAGEMSMSASDFLLLYGSDDQKEAFDAVTTVFFLDTAPNVIRYLETIQNCLRPGGLLINFGPLLWHFENNAPGRHSQASSESHGDESRGIADPGAFELTNDELLALVDRFGFDVESAETGIPSPYIQDPTSMLINTYQASFWVARKRLRKSTAREEQETD